MKRAVESVFVPITVLCENLGLSQNSQVTANN